MSLVLESVLMGWDLHLHGKIWILGPLGWTWYLGLQVFASTGASPVLGRAKSLVLQEPT